MKKYRVEKNRTRVLDDICPQCEKLGDVERLYQGEGKFGVWNYCRVCDFKKSVKRIKTKEEVYNERYPQRKENIKKRKLAERNSKKVSQTPVPKKLIITFK